MEFGEKYHTRHAQDLARSAMGSLKMSAEAIEHAIGKTYDVERITRLHQLLSQVWAMEGLARDVEHQLAQHHAEIRD